MNPVRPKTSARRWVVMLLLTAGFAAAARAMEPRPLPDYRARVLGSDQEVRIAGLLGQAILINTWATCAPRAAKRCLTSKPFINVTGTRARAWRWSG